MRRKIPTVLTVLFESPALLLYLEAVNSTSDSITLHVEDLAGLLVIPDRLIEANGILTYECKYGAPINGIQWKASADGLVGWFRGEPSS
jgi:hypothetical protein